MIEPIRPFVEEILAEMDQISEERCEKLDELADFVRGQAASGLPARLTFICTHNSRRSQLTQIWAQIAAAYYDHSAVETFSGGTETTACNVRVVSALRRVGLSVVDTTGGENPVYLIQYAEGAKPIRVFSKRYDGGDNPKKEFAAVMVCTDADKNCPVVFGCTLRHSLPFVDPNESDGTEVEAETYDERTRQIAREMFYVMERAKAA